MKFPEQLERRAEKFDVHAVHIPRLPRFETRPAWSLPNLTYDHIQRALFEGQILAEQRSVELQARALVLEHKTIGRAVCTSIHLQAARGNVQASHLSDRLSKHDRTGAEDAGSRTCRMCALTAPVRPQAHLRGSR